MSHIPLALPATDLGRITLENARLREQNAQLTAAVERVRAMHRRVDWAGVGTYCEPCSDYDNTVWPCRTMAALDGVPPGDEPAEEVNDRG